MWLSVIIPAYNCRNTIERLLNSIVAQNDKDVEVVICDDCSTDNFMELVQPYAGLLQIHYCTTKEHKIHCPGNTRQDGLDEAIGDWVTFIDNDDAFEPDVFHKIHKYIDEHECSELVVTQFREWFPETETYKEGNHDEMTWMHGKFYNRQFLIDNDIRHCEDLESHEDLYFNGVVYSRYIGGKNFPIIQLPTYKWIYEPTSLSRSWQNQDKYNYLEVHFHDYLFAASEPWFDAYEKTHSEEIRYKLAWFVLYGFFYLQGSVWRLGEDEIITQGRQMIYDLMYRIMDVCGYTVDDICHIVYKEPEQYTNLKKICNFGMGQFVEVESFWDFCMRGKNEREKVA